MAAFNKMTIWEVRRRIDVLCEFRNLVIEYYDNVEPARYFQNQPNEQGAQTKVQINAIFDEARESMYLAGFYGVFGNSYGSVSVIDNLYGLNEIIRPELLVDEVEKAVGKYKRNIRKAKLRTLNPFFWLNELLALILGFPFRLLASAGLVDKSRLHRGSFLCWLRGFFVFAGTLVTYALGFVSLMEKLGYIDAIKSLIRRVF